MTMDDGDSVVIWASSDPTSLNTSFIEFFQHFAIMGADGDLADQDDIMAATIYFLPSCDAHIPTGVSGGENFGILAKIPVLVE